MCRSRAFIVLGIVVGLLLVMMSIAACGGEETTTTAAPGGGESTAPAGTEAATANGEAKYIIIGNIETVSGPSSSDLKRNADGVRYAAEWYNEKGGVTINGEKYLIKIEYGDSQMSVEGATNAANDLIHEKKCQFMTGSYPPHVKTAVYQVCEQANILYAAPWNCSMYEEMNENTPLQFMTAMDNFTMQKVCLDWVKEYYPDAKTFAYILVDDGQIKDNQPFVRDYAASIGLEMLGDIIPFALGTVDVSPLSQQAMSRNPDFIMTGNGGVEFGANVVKTAREAGYKGLITYNNANNPMDMLKIAGAVNCDNVAGMGYTEETPDMTPLMLELLPVCLERQGFLDDYFYRGFDNVYQLVQAIEKAQSLKTEDVVKAWESMDDMQSVMGDADMGGIEYYGLPNHQLVHSTPRGHFEKGTWLHDGWAPATIE